VLKQESLKICKPRFVLMNRVTWVILKLIVWVSFIKNTELKYARFNYVHQQLMLNKIENFDIARYITSSIKLITKITEVLRIASPYSTMGEPVFKYVFTYRWSLLNAHLKLTLRLDQSFFSYFFINIMS
jgi:hypothetical protein